MAFHFSLATVLRVRVIIEEREEGILQKILFDISKVFDDLERIDTRIAEADDFRHAEVLKPCIGLDVHASYGEVKELKQRRKRPRRAEFRNSKRRRDQPTRHLRSGAPRSRNAHRYARKETHCV